jgi:hypothetical protein
MARQMSFAARWGSACGMAFDSQKFLAEHPQYEWMKDVCRAAPRSNEPRSPQARSGDSNIGKLTRVYSKSNLQMKHEYAYMVFLS